MRRLFDLRLSPLVYDQLINIFDYISTHSPQNARQVIDELDTAIQQLSDGIIRHKTIGSTRSARLPVHCMIVNSFNVYYSVDEARHRIRILEVRHHAQRQPRSFQ